MMQVECEAGPRERAIKDGIAAVSDADLLAMVLGSGFVGRPVSLVAAMLLEEVGGLAGLVRRGPSLLATHAGLGNAKALRIAAAIELGRRAVEQAAQPRASLCTSVEVAAFLAPRVLGIDHEEMWVVALDGKNRFRSIRRVAQGGLHGCSVRARDILRGVLLDAASVFILAHNHPSGDPTPSLEDIAMTRAVYEAACAVGIPLVDHVVVTCEGRHASMLDLGILPELPGAG